MSQRDVEVKKHQKEIGTLLAFVGLNEIKDTSEKNIYTFTELEHQKRQLTRMMVLDSYLQVDVKMSILVVNSFFHHCCDEYEDLQRITTSKEFTVFSEKILNEMPFLRKVAVIKSFITIPKDTLANINKLNDLRNAITHSLIPENLANDRVMYKRKSIFTLNGAKTFNKDVENTMSFLQKHFVQAFKDNKNKK